MKIARRAADAGFADAARLFSMTPAEIELALAGFAAQEQRRMERLDAAAWMVGRYAAFAWHAPKRYPKRPDCVKKRPPEMTDEEMKRVLVGLAGRKGEI